MCREGGETRETRSNRQNMHINFISLAGNLQMCTDKGNTLQKQSRKKQQQKRNHKLYKCAIISNKERYIMKLTKLQASLFANLPAACLCLPLPAVSLSYCQAARKFFNKFDACHAYSSPLPLDAIYK